MFNPVTQKSKQAGKRLNKVKRWQHQLIYCSVGGRWGGRGICALAAKHISSVVHEVSRYFRLQGEGRCSLSESSFRGVWFVKEWLLKKRSTDKQANKYSSNVSSLISSVVLLGRHHQLLYFHAAKWEALSTWLDVNGPLTLSLTGSCKKYIF